MRTHVWKTGCALVGLVAIACLPTAQADTYDPNTSPARCGPKDAPEPGVQGDVPPGSSGKFNCGVTVVGQLTSIGGPLAMGGDCAYVGGVGTPGVGVIDMRNPAKPKVVNTLPTSNRENLSTAITKDRALLATRHRETAPRQGSSQVIGRDMMVDIWDIRNCRFPKLLGSARFPTNNDVTGDFAQPAEVMGPVHNVNLSPDGMRVYGTEPLQVADISDLKHPSTWKVRDIECEVAAQHNTVYKGQQELCHTHRESNAYLRQTTQSHEVDFNKSSTRMYAGGGMPYPPGGDELMVIDVSKPDPKVLGMVKDTPGHSIDAFTIKGKPYLMSSMEISSPAVSCIPEAVRPSKWLGFGDAVYFTDISNERDPKHVTKYRLAVNKLENCPTSRNNASIHYHGVDNRWNTTFAMISYTSAGLRILDLRRPEKPTEVAYFNHGSGATDPIYNPRTGHIWYIGGGSLWVLKLQPQVVKHLGLR